MAPYVSRMTRPLSRRSCTTLTAEVPISTPMTLFASLENNEDRENAKNPLIIPFMPWTLGRLFVVLLLPPRSTERVVRNLTLRELQSLGGEEPLPYRDPRVTALVWECKYYGTARAAALAGAYLSEQLLAVAQ